MNTKTGQKHVAGNTYLAVIWITMLVGMILAAYLKMVGNQNAFSMRSQSWNRGIAVVEAGIEEALAHLNKNGTTNYNLAADGWELEEGRYVKARQIGDSYYIVKINAANASAPEITSRAYVPLVQNFVGLRPWRPLLASIGDDLINYSSYVTRAVVVKTKADGTFKGLVARHTIDLNGNNIKTDSFDSGNPLYSTNGMYYEPWSRDNGDVVTNSGLTNTANIDVGNANIRGQVMTGPKGSVTVGPNGAVGNKSWHDAKTKGIQPGWSRDDMNTSFPPVPPPFSNGYFTPTPGVVGGTNYTYVLSGEKYLSSSVNISSSQKILVTGNAVWRVTGDFLMSGNAELIIAPGASLKLYVGQTYGSGTRASLGGNGVINGTGYSTNFMYYGLPSNTSLSQSGNAAFIGAIYAPNAAFSMDGGGSSAMDFFGGSVTASAVMNGSYNFHFDEALARDSRRLYKIRSWNEI